MPAVLIRQLEALAKIVDHTSSPEQRELLLAQAAMILRASEESVDEPSDRADVLREYESVLAAAGEVVRVHVIARQTADPVA